MDKSTPINTTKRLKSNMDKDYISDLPESVISSILCRLPIMDALRTSVLAKDWKFKWTSIYEVCFDDYKIKSTNSRTRYLDFVQKTLVTLKYIETFRLWCSEAYDLSTITAYIYYVFRFPVKSFKVYMLTDEADEVKLSSPVVLFRSLLNCTSLEKLKLTLPCIFKVSVRNRFPNLKKLTLSGVQITNLNTVPDSVIFTFPVLEYFELYNYDWHNLKSVEIYAPNLKEYSCEARNVPNYEYSIKIIGAKLGEFYICGGFVENFILAESTIRHARLVCYISYEIDNNALKKVGLQTRKLLRGCSSIERLDVWSLSKALAKSKTGLSLPLFDKLENLNMGYVDVEGLLELLHATPYLKFLNLGNQKVTWEDYDFGVERSVPSCVVSCLEKSHI